MALIVPGPMATVISGKIGGTVFAHNAGGKYARSLAIPTDPGTARQQQIRNALSNLSEIWSEELTPAQRAAWQTYAANVPVINRVGATVNISGIAMYNLCNVGRLQASLARIDAAPTVFNRGVIDSTLVVTPVVLGEQLNVAFDDTLDWVNEDGSALLIYVSRQQNQSINFFKGPYAFAGAILGDSTTPPTSPDTSLTPQFPITAGNKSFFRGVITRADGRYSPDTRGSSTISAT